MRQIVLGLGNKARHGKDTVASVIKTYCENNGIPVMVLPFAEALRREVTNAITAAGSVEKLLKQGTRDTFSLNTTGKTIVGSNYIISTNATGAAVRRIPDWVKPSAYPDLSDPLLPHGKHSLLLQWWGTEYRRAQDPNYWVKKFVSQVKDFPGVVIAQDVRFTNEAQTIKELGGLLTNVTRLNVDGTPFRDPSRDANHPSETQLDDYNWDYRLVAHTGEVAWLESQALNLFDYIMARLANEAAAVASISNWKSYPEHCTFTLPKAA